MSFINPAFLWAMFAVSVPIVIHLINFRRHKTLYFSNTRFLEDIKKETQTRTKLKHLLILIARILTIAMLVLAFAGPFIPNNVSDNDKVSEVNVIYVDNSFSMETDGKKGQLFDQAKQIAKEIVFNSSASMEYLLITNDMLPENQFITSRDVFLRNLDKTNISSNAVNINDIILKANTLIPENKKASLYIISDMQKSFMDNVDTKPNENIDIVLVPVIAAATNNLFIDTCWFSSPVHRFNGSEILNVRIVNSSKEDLFDLSLQLFINDSIKAMSGFDIEAGRSKDVEISYVNTTEGFVNGRLEVADYPVTYDNTLYFSYRITRSTSIQIIEFGTSNKYLHALFNSDFESFDLTQQKAGTEQSSGFSKYDLIILDEVKEISSGLSDEIQSFVTNGGSVVFIPASEININSCNMFLNMFNAGKFDAMKYTNSKVHIIEYNSDIYKDVFQKQEKQTDLPVMGMVHHHVLYSSSVFSPVLRLENGASVLSYGSFGQGKFYILAAPINETNSDFIKSPLFATAFINMALNSQINNSLYAVLSKDAYFEISADIELSESDIFKITDNKNVDAVAQFRFSGKKLRVEVPEQIVTDGYFELIKGSEFIAPISLNYSRQESILEYLSDSELGKYITQNLDDRAKIIDAEAENISIELKEFSEGKPLWRLFLIFALVFILCEIMIARLMK
ncbi:MAG TPA: BatA domain-containing protein [Bacteroidales bacterium]|nr:BatA domain-containing protein [Bacteroidales bacterium]